MAEGSWSKRMSINHNAKIVIMERIKNMYLEIDEYTNNIYSNTINEKILYNEFYFLQNSFDIKKIKLDKYKKYYSMLSIRQRAKIYVGAYFPCVVTLWRKLRENRYD